MSALSQRKRVERERELDNNKATVVTLSRFFFVADNYIFGIVV